MGESTSVNWTEDMVAKALNEIDDLRYEAEREEVIAAAFHNAADEYARKAFNMRLRADQLETRMAEDGVGREVPK